MCGSLPEEIPLPLPFRLLLLLLLRLLLAFTPRCAAPQISKGAEYPPYLLSAPLKELGDVVHGCESLRLAPVRLCRLRDGLVDDMPPARLAVY
mmetsp:Transcript_32581/g.75116  ORF Transcript_32581/g.75116 Transcript_32581/m.75116 type:complete len:93 (+) Transcript_32581:747-1025(+)